MMKILIVALFLFTAVGHADTPLTSTEFWQVYLDSEPKSSVRDLIHQARKTVNLTPEMMAMLSNPSVSNGAKLALINAIFHQGSSYTPGWTPGAAQYFEFLSQRYGTMDGAIDAGGETIVRGLVTGATRFTFPEKVTPGELMSLGYLVAADRYDVPKNALPFLYGAVRKAPRSFAARVAFALAIGNMVMNVSDFADITGTMPAEELRKLPADKLNEVRQSFNGLATQERWAYVYNLFVPLIEKRSMFDEDLNPDAFAKVMEYIKLFKTDYDKARAERERLRETLGALGISCAGVLVTPSVRWMEPGL